MVPFLFIPGGTPQEGGDFMKLARALTVAGSDSGGGAGIQADLKTFTAYRTFGMSAVTALTAQNTIGVQGIHPVPADFVAAQIDSVAEDIGVDAVKTGMLADEDVVLAVVERVTYWSLSPLVVDPVMVARSGDRLLQPSAENAVREHLVPITTVLTPNVPEAEVLCGSTISHLEDMKKAARTLGRMGAQAVVLKGGHLQAGDEVVDVFWDGTGMHLLRGERVRTGNTHGTGCTFSAAVAAGLARGWSVSEAVVSAKKYVTRAIRHGLDLGEGHGPTNHLVGVDEPAGCGQ